MWLWHTSVLPQQDKIARQNFGDNMPYLENLDKNVSLVFSALQTTHYAVTPKVPALIELGAIHLKQVKPLSKVRLYFLQNVNVNVQCVPLI